MAHRRVLPSFRYSYTPGLCHNEGLKDILPASKDAQANSFRLLCWLFMLVGQLRLLAHLRYRLRCNLLVAIAIQVLQRHRNRRIRYHSLDLHVSLPKYGHAFQYFNSEDAHPMVVAFLS